MRREIPPELQARELRRPAEQRRPVEASKSAVRWSRSDGDHAPLVSPGNDSGRTWRGHIFSSQLG